MSRNMVDVVIPVYRDYEATRSCILSVLSADNAVGAQVVVINDASDDADICSFLAALCAGGAIRLIANTANKGFVHAVNQGAAAGGANDMVIVNSDTVVFSTWLDRLRRAAYSAENIGTVTPFSNNATICSYPTFNADNPFDARIGNQQLDSVFADVNAGMTCDIPTGVGFCMYIKRACLNDTGPFDEHAFGKGYGEENDFCLRARARGWRNVLAADVFVPHRGGASFAAARKPALQRSLAVLEARHPGYRQAVQRFARQDPLLGLRRAVDARLLAAGALQPLALRVCHDRGGGTAKRLRDEAQELKEQGLRVATLLPAPGGPAGRARLCLEDAPECVNLAYDLPGELGLLVKLLYDLKASAIVFHHCIDHDPSVLELPRRLNLPYSVVAHDFGWYCPGINLLSADNAHCNEPDALVCRACAAQQADPAGGPADLAGGEQARAQFLAQAANIIAPSRDTALRYFRRTGARNITVRPHSPGVSGGRLAAGNSGMAADGRMAAGSDVAAGGGRMAAGADMGAGGCMAAGSSRTAGSDVAAGNGRMAAGNTGMAAIGDAMAVGNNAMGAGNSMAACGGDTGRRARVAVFGAIGRHKGYDVLLRCARDAQLRELPLEFVLLGTSLDDYPLFRTGRVFVTGRYDESDLPDLLNLYAPQMAFYPSVWPETWCFTLDIAFAFNIYPVAFAMGAPEERIRAAGFGCLLAPDAAPATINDTLLDIARAGHGRTPQRATNG